MNISINKEFIIGDEGTDLLSLVHSWEGYVDDVYTVLVNGKVITKDKFSNIILKNGDKVNIVPTVSGG